MNDIDFKRQTQRLLWAWIALLALMFASLGSAYVPLGAGNVIAGLVIAAIKSGIVAIVFMRLASASAMVRIAAATALVTWGLLVALSGVDYATRANEPALYQPPQQVPAFNAAKARP
jgi:cytochrome c oxidase subunit 4